MRLIVATRNAHKTREIQRILGPGFEVCDLSAHGDVPDIRETGKSFDENAKLKAVATSKRVPGPVVADDSGLEVDALGGAPGIHSARYAGANATDKEKVSKLLSELARVGAKGKKRRARFRCVLGLAQHGRLLEVFEGVVEGKIADEPRGSHGFGYDPIFIPNGFKETFGELPEEVKNKISHRAKAILRLRARLAMLCDGV
jgi:XTP/dITP diphosphohydrolase